MSKPVISFVITNYNYSVYLPRCIESCINQHSNLSYEIIVVDDGSTDDSVAIVESYGDSRLQLIQLENSGIEIASNAGIRLAQAEWVVRIDADDYLLPNYLNIIIHSLKSREYAFIYPDYIVVDDSENILFKEQLPDFSVNEIRARGDFLATGTVYRRSLLLQMGLYDTAVKNCGLENYHLILRLIAAGNIGLHIPCVAFAYRRHNMNISLKRKREIIAYGNELFLYLGMGPYRCNEFHPYKLRLSNE